jgi:hypothetical protein
VAQIFPYELDAARAQGWARGELETLDRLELELGDEYSVYHGVHWARVKGGASVYGEIDFLVVNRYGRVLAIEQKNGPVQVLGNELVKTYDSQPCAIRVQVTRNLNQLRDEFARRHGGANLSVDHLLYCPEARLLGQLPVGIATDRIIDASNSDRLCERIADILETVRMPTGARPGSALAVHAFLSERVDVVPDIDAVSRQARGETRRLAGGLTTWAQRLTISPFRLRVSGTAGSGKTQLALAELQAAAQRGEQATYVCFNRPLAEAMRRMAPASAQVSTFHELGRAAMVARQGSPDFSQKEVWSLIASAAIERACALKESTDVLVIDEGQDLEGAWVEALVGMVKEKGRALLLEDADQRLYERRAASLSGWVGMHSPVNYRSPQVVVTLIEQMGLVEGPLRAGGPVHGWDPEMHVYASEAELIARTEEAVKHLLDAGHAPADIVVLSWQGVGRSVLMRQDRLAGLTVSRATGSFDEQGQAVYTQGELRIETVHRFKGQSADCVVIAGIEFERWTDEVRRRLFVAMTRARIRLALVVGPLAEQRVLERLADSSPATP